MEVKINTIDGAEAGVISLCEEIFSLTPRIDIMQRVVRWQLARRQQGSHQAQGRSTIARTGAKLYKQKGTGRARHSSARAPQFRGGGKAHGPVSRSHAHNLPKKVRALGLKHALSSKYQSNVFYVFEDFALKEAKTKILADYLQKWGFNNALFVRTPQAERNFALAAANLPNIDMISVEGLNVYDILRRDKLIFSKAALEALEERLK